MHRTGRCRCATGEERLKQGQEEAAPDPETRGALARVILAASRPDDLVLDPFCGTGPPGRRPSGWAALPGIERDSGYAEAAKARIAAVESLPEASLATSRRRATRRGVAFSGLIERGMIAPGDKLTDAKRRGRRWCAPTRHHARRGGRLDPRMGALAQGLEACNGWTYWHVEKKGALMLIDRLRARCGRKIGESPAALEHTSSAVHHPGSTRDRCASARDAGRDPARPARLHVTISYDWSKFRRMSVRSLSGRPYPYPIGQALGVTRR